MTNNIENDLLGLVNDKIVKVDTDVTGRTVDTVTFIFASGKKLVIEDPTMDQGLMVSLYDFSL